MKIPKLVQSRPRRSRTPAKSMEDKLKDARNQKTFAEARNARFRWLEVLMLSAAGYLALSQKHGSQGVPASSQNTEVQHSLPLSLAGGADWGGGAWEGMILRKVQMLEGRVTTCEHDIATTWIEHFKPTGARGGKRERGGYNSGYDSGYNSSYNG